MKDNSLLKNSVYNVLYKCLNVIFPLVTSIYASRVLQADGIGIVASAQNIVLYFTTIASLGIPTYGIKKIAESRDNKSELTKTFLELFTINLFSSVICSVIYYSMIIELTYFFSQRILYIVCGLNIVFNIINVDWFYQGIEEYRYIMFRSMVIKLLSLVLLFILVRGKQDYVYYAFISSLALVLNYCFNILYIRKIISIKKFKLNVWQHIKPVFILLGAVIAVEIYTLADTTMLTMLCDESTVGLYSNSMKMIKIVRSLIVAICAVFLPRLSYYYSKGKTKQFNELIDNGLKILFTLTLPAALGLILISDVLIPTMFGTSFLGAVITTKILSISIITVAFSNFLGYQVLVTVGREKQMMYSTIFGAAINVVLNAILIKVYQQNGAALASVATEAGVMFFQIVCVRNLVSVHFNKTFVSSIIIGLIAMGMCVVFIKGNISNPLINMVLSVAIGGGVYL